MVEVDEVKVKVEGVARLKYQVDIIPNMTVQVRVMMIMT